MKEKQMKSFVKVDYNLLATTKLSSTQKLFVSYIIGWQKNGKICFETNNTLALKFGMKYGGMRSVITTLNKFDFFKAIKKDYDERTGTSGHEIRVNIEKLESFLAPEISMQNFDATVEDENHPLPAITNAQSEDSNEEVKNSKSFEDMLITYQLGDTVNIYFILEHLGYKEPDDVLDFVQKANSTSMNFQKFIAFAKNLHKDKNSNGYEGIIITDEVLANIHQMIQD
ncbi:hypothetical protein [Flavobacterium muglaense]|uniref:Uncharacterized protein n=1 Tax=Flavobacterium muglaense TaxID=2764716 RepID=A0A923SF59_9FLAO|nr:hypothetical protein [Flavobacterium muglaense]MBC5837594.1 hypothetical protein [Flavobacterium muglaense]MBC5844120.1 hypothetical protein [Flavobacterium muglaense]